MRNVPFANLTVFLLFFGLAFLAAVREQNWLMAALFIVLGLMSLRADLASKERVAPHKRIPQFLRTYYKELISASVSLLFFSALLSSSGQLLGAWNALFVENQRARVESGLQQELGYFSRQREEIISSKVLNNALREENSSRLLAIAQDEARNRTVNVVIADADGFVLVRSHLPGQKGDNILRTTVYGNLVARGETVTAIVRGARNPLISISGSLIRNDDGEVIGSISVGRTFNHDYASEFREKYLDSDSHIAFYTPQKGMIGTSMSNPRSISLLGTLLSSGSDVATARVPQVEGELKIDGRYYVAHTIIFPGLTEESPGGLVALIAVNHHAHAAFLAGATVLIFALLYFFFPHFHFLRRAPYNRYLAVLFGIILFSAAYATSFWKLDQATLELTDSPYTIYNSTMKIEPEADIVSEFVEKTVALKLFTGGEAINVVRVGIAYDPRILKVLDILTTNSLCDQDLFLTKDIDNKNGKVTIACVTSNTNPGFYEPVGTVAELVILPVARGDAALSFTDETQVLASDGFETDVLRTAINAHYQVAAAESAAALPRGPLTIFSPSHPNSSRWYHEKRLQLTWPRIEGAVYHYALSRNPEIATLARASTTTFTISISK